MSTNAAVHERENNNIARGVGIMTQVYADHAENSEIWDVEGNRYIDLLTCGVYGNVIRFLAPVTIQHDVFNEAVDILEASITDERAKIGGA